MRRIRQEVDGRWEAGTKQQATAAGPFDWDFRLSFPLTITVQSLQARFLQARINSIQS
ncbi:hypothetical protein FIBSPDRAFT_863896 [Athelia psychrophila]|uniref:Uncharacterized protein n=1 Tax=Athelia psychrophila TaxID=1759441 RepID=A0A166H270_9AGAM|nr:hypothetical protein FIBSPDRAFT_863896 [Fibularhizoctonia sp. CBS 109695]